MIKRLTVVAIVAVVAAAATLASNPMSVAADPGEDDIGLLRRAASVEDDGGPGEDGAGLMLVASSGDGAMQTRSINPWGCRTRAHDPHESQGSSPGPGNVHGKTTIECNTTPPPHTAEIVQELSKWNGLTFIPVATKTSNCPSRVGAPDCYPNRRGKVLMRGYISAPCEIGTTERYLQIAIGRLTVGAVTYIGYSGNQANVECEGPSG